MLLPDPIWLDEVPLQVLDFPGFMYPFPPIAAPVPVVPALPDPRAEGSTARLNYVQFLDCLFRKSNQKYLEPTPTLHNQLGYQPIFKTRTQLIVAWPNCISWAEKM